MRWKRQRLSLALAMSRQGRFTNLDASIWERSGAESRADDREKRYVTTRTELAPEALSTPHSVPFSHVNSSDDRPFRRDSLLSVGPPTLFTSSLPLEPKTMYYAGCRLIIYLQCVLTLIGALQAKHGLQRHLHRSATYRRERRASL